jgi:hypothetical protein
LGAASLLQQYKGWANFCEIVHYLLLLRLHVSDSLALVGIPAPLQNIPAALIVAAAVLAAAAAVVERNPLQLLLQQAPPAGLPAVPLHPAAFLCS